MTDYRSECAIQMFRHYNKASKDEAEMQKLLQTVKEYNKKFPSYNKNDLK